MEAGSGALDDLDCPVSEFGEGVTQVGAVVDTIGEEMSQPGKQLMDGLDDELGPIAILDIGGVHRGTDSQTASIGHNVALAALDLLGGALAKKIAGYHQFHAVNAFTTSSARSPMVPRCRSITKAGSPSSN